MRGRCANRVLVVFCLAALNTVAVIPAAAQFENVTTPLLEGLGDGRGVAWADYNRDGRMDIFVIALDHCLLFSQTAGGSFADNTSPSGLTIPSNFSGVGAAWGDYDNDGYLDIYLVSANPYVANILYRNNGNGTFSDVTGSSGPVGVVGISNCGVWGDYDNDGYIDLYVVNYGADDVLLRNDGDGTFSNVSSTAGIQSGGSGRAAVWGDYDNDGDLDLYVSSANYENNRLYENEGNGTFTPRTDLGIGCYADNSMTASWIDYNNDGLLDLFVVNNLSSNRLFKNNGSPLFDFTDVSEDSHLDYSGSSRCAVWSDFNGDGFLDLYLGILSSPGKFYAGNGSTFLDRTSYFQLDDLVDCITAAAADFDNDGFMDLYGVSSSSPNTNMLFKNTPTTYHYLRCRLIGTTSNGAGIGARIKTIRTEPYVVYPPPPQRPYISYETVTRIREISGGSGKSQNSMIATIGLKDIVTSLDELQVIWPSGYVQEFSDVKVDQTLVVKEPGWESVADDAGVKYAGQCQGVSWGDYDNDGNIDMFVCGESVRLLRNLGNGYFGNMTNEAGFGMVSYVTDAEWGDMDNDGDLDLYLAAAAPRLYRNDGAGVFSNVSGESGISGTANVLSAVWCDYNDDLDLDLYLVRSGPNVLYENDGDGTFTLVNKGVADPGTGKSAVWGYFDDDDDLDLYVVNYGDNHLYINNGAVSGYTFSDETVAMNAGDAGPGFAAAPGDFDNDGDMDLYIVNDASATYPNKLLVNSGGGGFTPVTVGPLAHAGNGRDASWIDYDNDGDLDLYLVNYAQSNKIFRNEGNGIFVDDTRDGVPLVGGAWVGGAWADYDDDGDLDVYLTNSAAYAPNDLYQNNHYNGNHWLQVDLRAYESAIGCEVRVIADGRSMYRWVSGGSGYLSQNSLPVEFGLGDAETASSVQVTWANGTWTTLYNVDADQTLTIYQYEPSCYINRTSIDFGLVDFASEHFETFRITNAGSYRLQGIVELAEDCSGYFSITQGAGYYNLGAGEYRDVTVRYAPNQAGHHECTVELNSDLCGGIELSGDCDTPPVCVVTPINCYPAMNSCGNIGWYLAQLQTVLGIPVDTTFTITNTGGSTLHGKVVQNFSTGCPATCSMFELMAGDSVDFDLRHNESHDVTVRFDPLSNGYYYCFLDLGTAPSYGINDVSIHGSAGPPPECNITPATPLNFGTLEYGEYQDLVFTIWNTGGGLLIGTVDVPSKHFSVVSGAEYEISGGSYQNVTIRYQPLSAGTHACLIDPGLECDTDVTCTGTCLEPPVHLVSADCIYVDTVYVGTTFDTTFTITNTGGGTLEGYISEAKSYISILSGYGAYSLGHGETKAVTARFQPALSDTGFQSGEIYIGEGLNRMVFTAGWDMRVFDTWDLENPEPFGTKATLGMVQDLFILGNYAYVTTGSTGMQIYSIADPANPDLVSSMDLWGYEIFVADDYAYVCAGDGLKIIDISDPAAPSLISTFGSPSHFRGVYARGDSLFLTEPYTGFRVVDVSVPASPVEVGFCSMPGNDIRGVFVSGDYAYIACGVPCGVLVIDMSEPGLPVWITGMSTLDFSRNVFVDEPYLYVTDDSAGVHIFDVSDPENPGWVARYNTPGVARDIVVSGHAAYIADTEGILVLNVYNPYYPVLYASYDIDPPGYWCIGVRPGSAVMLSGTVVEAPECLITPLSIDFGGVNVYASRDSAFTIENIGGGRLCGTVSDTCGLYSLIEGEGSYSLFAGESKTVRVRFQPMYEGSFPCTIQTGSDFCDGVALSGSGIIAPLAVVEPSYYDFANTVVGNSRQVSFSIKNEGGETLDGNVTESCSEYSIMTGGGPFSLAAGQSATVILRFTPTTSGLHECSIGTGTPLCDRLLFLADNGYGLRIFNLSDPDTPSEVGALAISKAYNVAVSGNYAYVVADSMGLHIVDISDPSIPAQVGWHDTPGSARDVFVAGDLAYVADLHPGLQIFDISNPTTPVLLGNYNSAGAHGVVVRGNYAYLADFNAGLTIVNISNPLYPTLVGTCDTPGNSRNIRISGDYVYLSDSSGGLAIIDVSDPAKPVFVGGQTADHDWGIDLKDDYVYMADAGTAGRFRIVNVRDPENPVTVWMDDMARYARDVVVSGHYAYLASSSYGLVVFDVSDPANAVHILTIDTPTVPWGVGVREGGDVFLSGYAGYAYAMIDSIADVPNDQGKQVSIRWDGSVFDFEGSSTPITEYTVYRKVDESLLLAGGSEHALSDSILGIGYALRDSAADSLSEDDGGETLAYPPGFWQYILTMPAYCEHSYEAVVPTLADSTIISGIYYTTFFVRAGTATPSTYFDSPPDSGYSVDNLAPHVPLGFSAIYNSALGNELSWDECPDEDFQYFTIYRSEDEEFVPSPASLVHSTTETQWIDTAEQGWKYHYKIAAVDYSGNESAATGPSAITGDDTPYMPKTFALYQNVPNPFNPVTRFRFDLPRAVRVKLCVYNVKGQLVSIVLDRHMTEGRKEVSWEARSDSGRNLASGVYFYRLTAGDFVETKKMVLLR